MKNFRSARKNLKKVFESVNEENNPDTDEEKSKPQSRQYSSFRSKGSELKGILALTKENLLKLENQKLGNSMYVNPYATYYGYENTASEFQFSTLPGMNAGKMFKLTEVMSSYLGNSLIYSSQNPFVYNNMFYSLWQSCIGDSPVKQGISTVQTWFEFSPNLGKSGVFSSFREAGYDQNKEAYSDVNRVNNLSHLSEAGSDDYREELMRNENYLEDFKVESSTSIQ